MAVNQEQDTRPQILSPGVSFGADPELFLVKPGVRTGKLRVVGSERVLPKAGLKTGNDYGTVVTDGVQVELHPASSSCRQSFSSYLKQCIVALDEHLKQHPGMSISFDSVVTVTKREFVGLSDHARLLGCGPSFNNYGRAKKEVNGLEYRKRSAAGHMHLGTGILKQGVKVERLVDLLDLCVGIPSVLIDKDPLQRERRKLYGRAGEYRLPTHGIEYRTLGNFWLKSYYLMHLMFGLGRLAVNAAWMENQSTSQRDRMDRDANQYRIGLPKMGYAWDLAKDLMAKVDRPTVERAINRNDQDLAFKIYDTILKPTLKTVQNRDGLYTINHSDTDPAQMWDDFEFFISRPLDEWLPKDIVGHWRAKPGGGWESYVPSVVRPKRLTAAPKSGTSGSSVTAAVNR